MPKSQSTTDAEILSNAKRGDVILPETSSVITRRHTRSVHSKDCKCDLCLQTNHQPFSSKNEEKIKEELDWYLGE